MLGDRKNEDATSAQKRAELSSLARSMSEVTDATLRNPSDGDWLHFRRDYASQGYSPLKQINTENAKHLKVAWTLSLPSGTNGVTPLVHDGVVFVNSAGVVQAIRASDGEVIWQFRHPVPSPYIPVSQPRGMGIYGNLLFVGTSDNHMLALDTRTGMVVWDHEVVGAQDRLQMTGAPLVVGGKVIQGMSACMGPNYPGGCFIVALDAANGKEAWRFHTIARPGQPGGESWNGEPVERRSGAGVWTAGSYDPDLNLLYFGTGQTYDIKSLLRPLSDRHMSRDALYTDTTLALNPGTGNLVWYYQHMRRDIWDLDWSFERTLMDLPNHQGRVIGTIGKLGIADILDARTGRFVASMDIGLQNLVTRIDPHTGEKQTDPAAEPKSDNSAFICPYLGGARGWPATAYNPVVKVMYIPMFEWCMNYKLAPDKDVYQWSAAIQPRPDGDGKMGRVAAVNLETRKVVWTQRRRAPQSSAILATAGGLIFEGSRDRYFRASAADTGKELWQIRLNATPNSFPISFASEGVQYVAVVAGGGSILDSLFPGLTPEMISPTEGTTLWVFKVPEDAKH
jgi:alcohol dehydrogenase (cytochrome c)